MSSNKKWISNFTITVFVTLVLESAASAQVPAATGPQGLLPREIFNAAYTLYDERRFAEAETKFREVVRKFPRNPIADRADYYLIRTLAQLGRKSEALSRIDAFARLHPRSNWFDDVQEFRIQLTNEIPPKAESILIRTALQAPPIPAAPPKPPIYVEGLRGPAPTFALPAAAPVPFGTLVFQTSYPEISLQQEVLRALFHNDGDRAIEITTDRLKANPADPVVLSSLNLVASTQSGQGVPILLGIVRNSTNAKARRDAIYWLGQSRGDKDVIVATLLGLLPSLAEDDTESVAYTLSQIRSDKSFNALATIARDKSKSEKTRNNAIFWIGQARTANRVALLEDLYKNSMDNSKLRQQVLFALSQTHEPQAVTILGNIAASDPDIEVRKLAGFWLGASKSSEANQVLERSPKK
jgi:tetratricopeptide (TPR) repeat protein